MKEPAKAALIAGGGFALLALVFAFTSNSSSSPKSAEEFFSYKGTRFGIEPPGSPSGMFGSDKWLVNVYWGTKEGQTVYSAADTRDAAIAKAQSIINESWGKPAGLSAGVGALGVFAPSTTGRPITRESCIECVEKHLGAALVMLSEIRSGYDYRLRVIGHMHEAEDESQAWPALHDAIRQARKNYQQTGQAPNFEAIAQLVTQAA